MIYAVLQKYSGHQANIKIHNLIDLKGFVKDSDIYEKILSTKKSDYDSPICLRQPQT